MLFREQAAAALSEIGFRVSPATLASKASRGTGPRYVRFNGRVLYQWRDLTAWAEAQVTPGIISAAEVTDGLLRRLLERT
jgi:hypothetical protein